MDASLLADRLRKARAARGLTQLQAAAAAEIPASTIQKWEIAVNAPNAVALERLARLYGVSADYLLGLSASPSGLRAGSYLVDGYRIQALEAAEDLRDLRPIVAPHLTWVPWSVEITPDARVVTDAELATIEAQVAAAITTLRERDRRIRRLLDGWASLDAEWREMLRRKGLLAADAAG